MGFHPITLNEGREDSQPRRLEKSRFRDSKILRLWLGWGSDYPHPMHPLAPPENGIKALLSHLPINLAGLKVCGLSQYRAV